METLTLTGLLKRVTLEFLSQRAVSVSGKLDFKDAQLQKLVEIAASSLVATGIKASDVIALTFPNIVDEFVNAFLAMILARATAALLNQAYTMEEFEFYLSDSKSKLLLTSQEGNKAAQAAACKLEIPHATIFLPDADSDLVLSLSQSEADHRGREAG